MKHKTHLVIMALLLLMFAVFALSCMGITRTQDSLKLDSYDAYEVRNYKLPNFAWIDGTFTIESQGNQIVYFWVNAPNGQTIIHPFLANQTAKFSFSTIDSGFYTLYFDNEFEYLTKKEITLSFYTRFGFLGFYLDILSWIALVSSVTLLFVILSALKKKIPYLRL